MENWFIGPKLHRLQRKMQEAKKTKCVVVKRALVLYKNAWWELSLSIVYSPTYCTYPITLCLLSVPSIAEQISACESAFSALFLNKGVVIDTRPIRLLLPAHPYPVVEEMVGATETPENTRAAENVSHEHQQQEQQQRQQQQQLPCSVGENKPHSVENRLKPLVTILTDTPPTVTNSTDTPPMVTNSTDTPPTGTNSTGTPPTVTYSTVTPPTVTPLPATNSTPITPGTPKTKKDDGKTRVVVSATRKGTKLVLRVTEVDTEEGGVCAAPTLFDDGGCVVILHTEEVCAIGDHRFTIKRHALQDGE